MSWNYCKFKPRTGNYPAGLQFYVGKHGSTELELLRKLDLFNFFIWNEKFKVKTESNPILCDTI